MDKAIAPAAGEIKITSLSNCFACGGSHEDLLAKPFKQPGMPYTHWYNCPTADEPVSVGLMQKCFAGDPDAAKEIVELHHRMLVTMAALQGKDFVFAAFHIRPDDNKIECIQHSYFPNDRKLECPAALHRALESTLPIVKPREPLQRASQERLQLFGANGGKLMSPAEAIAVGANIEIGPSGVSQAAKEAAAKAGPASDRGLIDEVLGGQDEP